ncbi:DNA-directed DNA polymerase [Hydrogenobacter thermophilus TK-6]|uniref:DNA polymerase I n=1 Tax=Hydrogenobacter thermophilus (strain DSM 6534 / IAM 12695 / TK-6) TaxID=608538 RepID=D3DG91_HYDTT|nr:bifunctional 3'-5' exonuclease/DNA polymerase [Hydrogenobacter thermophilus]ADO44778.1 DNA-directed DNA polymerase [Hydrogenobacter thermophilus TK-6]BAI68843.1 DNA polymerase I [Hydrogenobacter thermophilus TK-6]
MRYSYITSRDGLRSLKERLKDESYLFLDTETVSEKIRLVQLGNNEDVFIVDLFETGSYGVDFLKDLLVDKGIVGHNLKYDLKFLYRYGIEPYAVFDTMIASQLLGELDRHSLQKVAMHYLGEVLDKSLQMSNWGRAVLSKEQLEYAALDVKMVRDLYSILLDKLNSTAHQEETLLKTRTSRVFGLKNPVAIIEMAFVQEVAKLELNGIGVDIKELEDLIREYKKNLNKKVMEFMMHYRIDPLSPKQLGELLSKRLGLDLPKTEKGNISTDDKILSQFIHHKPVQMILEIRMTKKLLDKLDEIRSFVKDGSVYPEFKQIGAITGRMSSLNPNVQNIPRDLRGVFKAREGKVLVISDFSQIELRIASEYVGDERMIKAFREGKDLHRYTASVLLGKKEEDISKEERQLAKAVNFGLIYGISARGLSDYAKSYGIDLSVDDAQKIRDRFFEYFRSFKEWHERVKRELKQLGGSRGYTLLGRSYVAHTFPDAVNYPIQGTGADLLKLSVLMFDAEIKREKIEAHVVNLVHDEIVVECQMEKAQLVRDLLERAMKHAGRVVLKQVPVEVESTINERWLKEG